MRISLLALTPLYVSVHKCPRERDVLNYMSECAEAIAKLNAARDSHPSTKERAR